MYIYIYFFFCQPNTRCCFQCFLGAQQYQKVGGKEDKENSQESKKIKIEKKYQE